MTKFENVVMNTGNTIVSLNLVSRYYRSDGVFFKKCDVKHRCAKCVLTLISWHITLANSEDSSVICANKRVGLVFCCMMRRINK